LNTIIDWSNLNRQHPQMSKHLHRVTLKGW
jgi:hypothetical protein